MSKSIPGSLLAVVVSSFYLFFPRVLFVALPPIPFM